MKLTTINISAAVFLITIATGCASIVVDPMLVSVRQSLEQQEDLNLIKDGTPALLLMLDGLLQKEPNDLKIRMAATQAYTAYAALLNEFQEPERAATISAIAKRHGLHLLAKHTTLGLDTQKSLADFTPTLGAVGQSETAPLFWGGQAWATWVRLQNGAPAAMADLPKVEQIMLRVLELDESYYYGSAHIFLGGYYGSLPVSLGGKPEESREHFERALAINDRNFLYTQVLYAETYARMTLNRELFQSLLAEALNRQTTDKRLISANLLAKKRAQLLLARIDEYFL